MFATYIYFCQNWHLFFQNAATSFINSFDTLRLEDPIFLDTLSFIAQDIHARYICCPAKRCDSVPESRGNVTKLVCQKGKLFHLNMRQLLEMNQFRNVRSQVGKLLMWLFIPTLRNTFYEGSFGNRFWQVYIPLSSSDDTQAQNFVLRDPNMLRIRHGGHAPQYNLNQVRER